MILSSPFSRQHRSHQTWHQSSWSQATGNGGGGGGSAPSATLGGASPFHRPQRALFNSASLRKPAPQQPAPQWPSLATKLPQVNGTASKQANSIDPLAARSSTLNRLDLLKARQQQQRQQQTQTLTQPHRNLSALGHYQPTGGFKEAPQRSPPRIPDGHARLITATRGDTPIYAPASIASPRELASRQQQQHYASASVHGNQSLASFELNGPGRAAPSRSGRESALSNLFERFGTLKRRARRHWPGRLSSTGSASLSGSSSQQHKPNELEGPPQVSFKQTNEAELIYAEGQRAIDGNAKRRLLEDQLDPELMEEGETRLLVDEHSQGQTNFVQLVGQLKGWINDELAERRIIVRDLRDDLHDGQILCQLLERLQRVQLDTVEVTQNELAQRQKLRRFLDAFHGLLARQARWARICWTLEGIHGRNLVEIIQLLVTLAIFYRAPMQMPADVQVLVHVYQKRRGQLIKRSHIAQLTDELVSRPHLNNFNGLQQGDAFDLLLESAPQKLALVEESLVRFCNRHLNKISLSCAAPDAAGQRQRLEPRQFSDGLLLVFLIASLEEFFVPLGNLFTSTTPISRTGTSDHHSLPYIDNERASTGRRNFVQTDLDHYDHDHQDQELVLGARPPTALEPASYVNTQPIERLHNLNVALQLIDEAGVSVRRRVRAEDLANGDLKALLRVLYALFSRYKHL